MIIIIISCLDYCRGHVYSVLLSKDDVVLCVMFMIKYSAVLVPEVPISVRELPGPLPSSPPPSSSGCALCLCVFPL